jgi:monoamine oxidase
MKETTKHTEINGTNGKKQNGTFPFVPFIAMFIQPDQFNCLWPAARQAEGRVHFAGAHTSVFFGWQDGALESAERVVREIGETTAF